MVDLTDEQLREWIAAEPGDSWETRIAKELLAARKALEAKETLMPTPLDERLAQIQKESGDLWLQLGQKEYVKRVLEAEMAQLCQKILQLNQEMDALKRATANASSA